MFVYVNFVYVHIKLFFFKCCCYFQGVFIFSFIGYENLTYQGYVYPWWGYVIGWFLALSSMVTVLLYLLFAFMAAEGDLSDVSTCIQ